MKITLFPSLLTALSLAAGSVSAALTVTEPRADHWWIAKSINTLRWDGSDPAQFSVFLFNPDPQILTSALALSSITNAYMTSLSISPGEIRPGTGYVIQLTDILNSTNVYATSETFEIKPQGSEYPPQSSPNPSGSGSTVTVSATNPGAGSSASSAAASPSGSAERVAAGSFGLVAAVAAWVMAA